MAQQIPRFISRRFRQQASLFCRFSAPVPRPFAPPPKVPALRRTYASTGESGPNPNPGQNPFKIWPFVAIFAAGTGAYVLMVNQRIDMAPTDKKQIPAPKKGTPTFSPDKVTVLFVLGGPGAGKGTQCANLVRDYNFTHLSAGDLLRAEQDREGSEFGDLIKDYIKEGRIVPMEVTVQLLENAITDVVRAAPSGKGKFLIDGFPRKMDQAIKFEETVCPSKFVLFYDCPEEEMQKRLLNRGKTSGRSDDNAESIQKRFKTFVETSMPVVDYFASQGRVVKVVATKSPAEVYKETKEGLEKRLGKIF
ncbi:adenylate kinase-domain-containing protein [Calycina marina]|uniref:Uridylate kinase n=1 Tax=Calycina marina TaxID=1763456 RepID=A0A9P7YXH3_9HELO|nr:adenylate kinase-domain-containing protein [Calycina marina]